MLWSFSRGASRNSSLILDLQGAKIYSLCVTQDVWGKCLQSSSNQIPSGEFLVANRDFDGLDFSDTVWYNCNLKTKNRSGMRVFDSSSEGILLN